MSILAEKEAEKQITVYRKDYQASDFQVEQIDLEFDLDKNKTQVIATFLIRRIQKSKLGNLVLLGHHQSLKKISLDGKPLAPLNYIWSGETLTIPHFPDKGTLRIETEIDPEHNTTLSGLYYADQLFCTQCEAQGFRRITYFLDRPDVMTKYTTTITADKSEFPVLLSNGNLIDKGDIAGGKHWVKWHDPFKKPSYLFALVAGKLDCLEDTYKTLSGRRVTLRIFVEMGKKERAHHAMYALKQAMEWDEKAFGREYDLDIFMIVAVSSFNMGAMENKGLNIFNDKYILVDPTTATDADYDAVTLVVGHEYFHNWTGNRITCRDWFQLSLKEGLTVFRESLFMQEQTSSILRRIQDARTIRSSQFAEDAGPMAHPVRPDSYVEINNFYTVTVYNKGAEVIRMLHTFVGEAGFRKGMDSYFERHDGQAVTIEDFVKAIAELNGFDYQPFLLWYSQSGTPQVDIKSEYHKHTKRYTLHFSQTCPPTPGQPLKNPFMIPVAMGLLDKTTGQELTSTVLSLTQEKQSFTFDNISAEVVPSLFRNFSAPVKVKYAYTDEELLHILQHDSDLFNRWDALQQLATELILELAEDYKENKPFYLNQAFAEGFRGLLNNKTLENRFLVECLVLPSENYLAQQVAIVHVDAIHAAREYVREALAKHCFETLLDCYQRHVKPTKYVYSKEAAAARALKNECLWYLMSTGSADIVRYCVQQFKSADNMTDQIAALAILANEAIPEADEALSSFYTTWRADHLVLDKWFSIQAYSKRPQAMERVKQLMRLPEYNPKNPNRVRALVGAFAMGNPVQFHALDNSGYAFLSDQIIVHHQANPQLAARLLTPLIQWRRFDEKRQALMKAQLMRLSAIPDLSRDVFEVVSKALA